MGGSRGGDDPSRPTLTDRLRQAFLKPLPPEDPSRAEVPAPPKSVDELDAVARSADDKERLIGLLGAPFAGAIAILTTGALIANDPPKGNKLHVSVAVYHELLVVLLVLSVVMLVVAMLRKRLYLGMVTALYGLALFNMHYWGFGIPYLMAGSWLLVRAYRFQRDARDAGGGGRRSSPGGRGNGGGARGDGGVAQPRPSKRYTPPTSPPRRSPYRDKRAG